MEKFCTCKNNIISNTSSLDDLICANNRWSGVMVCKFCGRVVKCVSGKLWANVGGNICQASENKKHELA